MRRVGWYPILASVASLVAVLSCAPEARIDPCLGCAGECTDAMCELASLEGEVSALAAGPTGIYACAVRDSITEIYRVTRDATDVSLGSLPGRCVGVVISGAFLYVGVQGKEGGVYRADLAGAGLHLEVPEPGLTYFTVHSGVVSMASEGRSTPVTVTPARGVREGMVGLLQASQAGPMFARDDGRLVWSVPENREVIVSSIAGEGGPVFNGAKRQDENAWPFLLAADGAGAVVADGEQLVRLTVGAIRFPELLASDLAQARAIAMTRDDVIVGDLSGVRAVPRATGDAPTQQLSSLVVSALATSDAGEIFAARGSEVLQVRRAPER